MLQLVICLLITFNFVNIVNSYILSIKFAQTILINNVVYNRYTLYEEQIVIFLCRKFGNKGVNKKKFSSSCECKVSSKKC